MKITTKNKLDYLKETKSAIKNALIEKGQVVEDTDTFRSYAEKITKIKSEAEMNEILMYQNTITGFTANGDLGGLYTANCPSELADFEIVPGQEYVVLWDDVGYSVIAQDASAVLPGTLFMGNGSALGLSGNGEPFAIGYSSTGITFVSYDTTATHSVGIIKRVRHQDLLLQDIEITENGEYIPDVHYDGFGNVKVDVKGSGGGGLLSGTYWKQETKGLSGSGQGCVFTYKGQTYAWAKATSTSVQYSLYKYDNGKYTLLLSDFIDRYMDYFSVIEFNGIMHFLGGETTIHYIFDGTNCTRINALPATAVANCAFVLNDTLYIKTKASGFYKWVEATDTWEAVGITGYPTGYESVCVYNGDVYICGSKKLYKVNWDTSACELLDSTLPNASGWNLACLGKYLYLTYGYILYRYDLDSLTLEEYSELPVTANYLQLHTYYGKVGIFGKTDYSKGINMTMHEGSEEVTLQDKTITENGTYTADSGFDGLGQIIVDVLGNTDSPSLKIKRTTCSIPSGTNKRVDVDFGFVPDLLVIYPSSGVSRSASYYMFIIGMSKRLADLVGDSNFVSIVGVNTTSFYKTSYSDMNSGTSNAYLWNVNENGFTTGDNYSYCPGTYNVFALGL